MRRSRWKTGGDGTEEADRGAAAPGGGTGPEQIHVAEPVEDRADVAEAPWPRPVADRGRRTSSPQLSNGPAAERPEPELGLGESESTHRWTAAACRTPLLACSDWSRE
jgi:hypothetical protein